MAAEPPAVRSGQQVAARAAAVAFLVPVALVIYANFGIRSRIWAGADIARTVERVAAAPNLFRLSIAFDLVHCLGVVAVAAALFIVLRPVNRFLALLAALWQTVYAVTAVLTTLGLLRVTRLTEDAFYLDALGPDSLNALVKISWASNHEQYYVGLAFWALSSTIFAWLWLKSRYVPAALSLFGLVSSAWCVACTFAYIINPALAGVLDPWWWDTAMTLFHIALSVWLLVRGLSGPGLRAATSSG